MEDHPKSPVYVCRLVDRIVCNERDGVILNSIENSYGGPAGENVEELHSGLAM